MTVMSPDDRGIIASEERTATSALVVCCGAVISLLVGLMLSSLLLRHLGVLPTCGVILLLFLSPMAWAMCRKENSDHGRDNGKVSQSLDQTWVVSFWCVCSLVLLMIANQA